MEQEGKNKIYILICEILYQYQPSRWIATQIHITWMIKWKKNQTVEGNGGAASGSGPLEEKKPNPSLKFIRFPNSPIHNLKQNKQLSKI